MYLSPWMPRAISDSVKEVLKLIDGTEEIEVSRSTLIQNDGWAKFGRSVVGEAENEAQLRKNKGKMRRPE